MVCEMISQLAHTFTVAYLKNSQHDKKSQEVMPLSGKCIKLDECLPVVVLLVVGILVVIPVVCLVVGC